MSAKHRRSWNARAREARLQVTIRRLEGQVTQAREDYTASCEAHTHTQHELEQLRRELAGLKAEYVRYDRALNGLMREICRELAVEQNYATSTASARLIEALREASLAVQPS